ncbi:MAG: (Fe-S)-binding protein [Verrucomicrobia bacterium]|nr:(Fe-S)-binding protein [Verrucomicrobiota bacterium]
MNPPVPSHLSRFLDQDKALACVHCGLCLSVCPTYLETGNENNSPRGRIYLMRALQDGRVPLRNAVVHHIDLCLGCRACEVACPSGVQYGELLEATRDHIEKCHTRSAFQKILRRIVIERVFPFPWRLKLALLPANLIRRFRCEWLLPSFARDALALLPDAMDATVLPEISPAATEPRRGRVGFISGCVMSVMFGRTNQSSVRLLNLAGYEVVTPPRQVCCGALYAHAGNLRRARACARRNIRVFEKLDVDAIIINAAGCGSTLKEYGQLLHANPKWAERGARFSAKVKDLVEWLAPLKSLPRARAPDPSLPATYHDACHLAHAQRITEPPRKLLRTLVGDRWIALPESDLCCGSAGSYNLTEPEMARRLRDRKVQNILKTGARTVVTTNPGCILQIQAGLRQAGAGHIRVVHLADFLVESLREATPGA